jgi:CMP/dCMP kinase
MIVLRRVSLLKREDLGVHLSLGLMMAAVTGAVTRSGVLRILITTSSERPHRADAHPRQPARLTARLIPRLTRRQTTTTDTGFDQEDRRAVPDRPTDHLTSAVEGSIPSPSEVNRGFAAVVALDGPSGTGKSTVARRLAAALGARYLDTGAMYRAATLAVLDAGVPADDRDRMRDVALAGRIDISTDPDAPSVSLDGRVVDGPIRSAEVTARVSAVSALPEVRARLVAQQRDIIGGGGIVVEGRDIGSAVWPAAELKVYLTATAEARARRRAGELTGSDLAAVAADIDRRDRLDSTRAASPLTQVADAVVVDTTYLSIDEVVKQLVDLTLNLPSA